MPDHIGFDPKMTADWRDRISHGDIVTYRFPLAEAGGPQSPKSRPCLVLDVVEMVGERFAVLAYGTTSGGKANRGNEIHLRRRADYLTAGLDGPTRFIGARRQFVALSDAGFAICRDTGSAVLGSLSGAQLERMYEIRDRIRAPHESRAERGSSRRGPKRCPAVRGRDFAVEVRRPRRKVVRRAGAPS